MAHIERDRKCTEINITTDVGCDTICLKNLVKKKHHDQSLKVWSKTIQISLKKQFFVKTDGPADVKSKGGLKTVSGSVKRDSISSTKTQKKEP